jgi:magnesium-transporting ATPase (P-type)
MATATTSPGLTTAEAASRLQARGPLPTPPTSRSYRSIVVANTFTIFNAILVAFGVLTLVFGDAKDALFLGIVVANTGIGIFQEVRAKRALDKLAAQVAPTAVVVRDGEPITVPMEDVVVGDLIRTAPGDQVVADGTFVEAVGIAIDESNLTGESEPVLKRGGDEVQSGSYVVEGNGVYEASAVGPDSAAAKLALTARTFRHPRSPLEQAMDRLLILLVGAMVPLAVVLGVSLALRDETGADAVQTMTAAIVNMVPEGLILLVSLTAAVSAAKIARRGVLAQQLNAIESLASVSVLCTDKTGTLTEAALRVVALHPADGVSEDALARDLARYAASATTRNGTLEAVHAAQLVDVAPEPIAGQVPFSSRRRGGALQLGGDGLVLGAPEAVLRAAPALVERASGEADGGRRVLALGRTDRPLPEADATTPVPDDVAPLGIVVLAERLRPDADRTVAFFDEEDVQLKVLSGDAPRTVGAIARDAGVRGAADTPALDGGDLPADDADLHAAILAAPAVGRISPEDKARVVRVLADGGAYTAMLGDGVNDVPALKQARLAIAQGSGTQMAKSIADLVLVRGDFAEVPRMVAEGRQILRNIQRVARLFVTKAIFTGFLLVTVAITTGVFPLLPRQFTLCSSLTIGIPAFLLALAPSAGPWRPEGFLKSVGRFSIPAGIALGLGILTSYVLARTALDLSLTQARTVTASTVVTGGLAVVIVLEDEPGRRRWAIVALCAVMLLAYVGISALHAGRDYFELEPATGAMAVAWAVGAAVSLVLLAVSLAITRRLTERAESAGQ